MARQDISSVEEIASLRAYEGEQQISFNAVSGTS